MKLVRYIVAMLLCLPLASLAAEQFVAGKDYKVMKVAAPVGINVATTNSVVEFFNPGCPACFHTEPAVESWLKRKPKAVAFSRVPVIFHDDWKIYSQAYYVAKGLGLEEQVVPKLFDAIHMQHKPTLSRDEMTKLFTDITKKYNAGQINTAFNSMTVGSQLDQAQRMTVNYQVYEIPAFLVNGKYLVSGSMAKSPERMLKIVDYLTKLK